MCCLCAISLRGNRQIVLQRALGRALLIGRPGFLQHSSHIFSGRRQRGIAETDAEGFLNLRQINPLITGRPFLVHDELTANAAEPAIASRHAVRNHPGSGSLPFEKVRFGMR
jgi:hypothetical protein